jgi:hypothetical protein
MKPATAQNIRRLGLAVEAACLLGLLTIARQPIGPRKVLGVDQSQALMTGLALGFTLWLVGTASYYWPKRKPGEKS